jgi:hypothetical protein
MVFAMIIGVFFWGVPVRQLAGGVPPDAVQNGDVNGDGMLDITDGIVLLEHVILGGPEPVACADSPELLARLASLENSVSVLREDVDDLVPPPPPFDEAPFFALRVEGPELLAAAPIGVERRETYTVSIQETTNTEFQTAFVAFVMAFTPRGSQFSGSIGLDNLTIQGTNLDGMIPNNGFVLLEILDNTGGGLSTATEQVVFSDVAGDVVPSLPIPRAPDSVSVLKVDLTFNPTELTHDSSISLAAGHRLFNNVLRPVRVVWGEGIDTKGESYRFGGSLDVKFDVPPPPPETTPFFTRGDVDADGEVAFTDAWLILAYLSDSDAYSELEDCLDAIDANDDGTIDSDDATFILNWQSTGGLFPPPGECGEDPTGDDLTCEASCPP